MMTIQPYKYGDPLPILGKPQIAWLRSNSGITTVSGLVSNWTDQSTAKNSAAQSTTSYRPAYSASNSFLNNAPSLNFSNSGTTGDDFLSITSSSSLTGVTANGFTLYMAARIPAYTSISFGMLMQHTNGSAWTNGWGVLYYSTPNNIRFFIQDWNTAANYVTIAPPSTLYPFLLKFTYDRGATNTIRAEIRQNGTSTTANKVYSGTWNFTGATDPEIARGGGTSYDMNMQISEIVMYSGVLSASDQTTVETILKTKYGIT